jgi:ADP-heptose:LPS heptosyltransferase
MNVKTMRAIDRFAGVPLCWLAGLGNAVVGRQKADAHSDPGTVLVMKFFGLGSVLLSTSFLSLLLERLPRARIIYLTFSSNRELLEMTGLPVEILTISNASVAAFTTTTITALRRLRSASIDVVFDLEFFSKFSTLVSVLCGARLRVGFDLPTWWRRSNLTHPVALEHSVHVTRLFLRQLGVIGIHAPDRINPIGLKASPVDKASMERKLDLAGDGSEVICININAGGTSLERRWRPHRFVEVARKLVQQDPSRRIYFIGDTGERPYVDAALQSIGGGSGALRNCSGALSLGELLALLQRSRFLLTNDSGPMHIAAAAGTPVVAMFGPESPVFYGPNGRSRICYKSPPCSPCLNIYNAKQFTCPYNTRCMEEISTLEVLAAIESLVPSARVNER